MAEKTVIQVASPAIDDIVALEAIEDQRVKSEQERHGGALAVRYILHKLKFSLT